MFQGARFRSAARVASPGTEVGIENFELAELRHAIGALGEVGRNPNQIASVAQQTGRVEGLTTGDLRAMLAAFEGLRGHFKGLIEANIASRETDHAKTSHYAGVVRHVSWRREPFPSEMDGDLPSWSEHLRVKCASDKDGLESAAALLGHANSQTTKSVYRRKTPRATPLR